MLFPEPKSPPSNVQGRNRGLNSVFVQWSNVPEVDQNGVILSYTVTYKALPDGSSQTKVVRAPTTVATLAGLKNNTNYSITVFASTVKGAGRNSAPIFVMTGKDCKVLYLIILTLHLSSSRMYQVLKKMYIPTGKTLYIISVCSFYHIFAETLQIVLPPLLTLLIVRVVKRKEQRFFRFSEPVVSSKVFECKVCMKKN